jgi:hypothetical protein
VCSTLGKKISSLLEETARELESRSDGCSVNTGFSGDTELLFVHETKHFAERKQERGVPDLDYKRVLKYGEKRTFRQDIVKYCLEVCVCACVFVCVCVWTCVNTHTHTYIQGLVVITSEGGGRRHAITTYKIQDWFSRGGPLQATAAVHFFYKILYRVEDSATTNFWLSTFATQPRPCAHASPART